MNQLFFKQLLLVAFLLQFAVGCATQRYGRMQKVTDAEGKYLTCENIDIELDKASEFIKTVNDADNEFTGKDVLSFLGDFGIGDSMEVTDAIQSGTTRVSELKTLQKEKGCKTS